jgi:hypothetical protein
LGVRNSIHVSKESVPNYIFNTLLGIREMTKEEGEMASLIRSESFFKTECQFSWAAVKSALSERLELTAILM